MSRRAVIAILSVTVGLLMGLNGCGGNQTPTTYSSTPAATPTQTTTPPINVKIDYFGIKSTHRDPYDMFQAKIQLHVVVDDGKTQEATDIPPTADGTSMDDFYLGEAMQRVFHTPSVGDHLKVSILAYSTDDREAKKAILDWAASLGQPGASAIKTFYDQFPQKKVLIGYYENTWYPTEGWGTEPGTYGKVGSNDLRLWFRIWSSNEPAVTPKPSFGPDIKIQVTLPSNAKKRPASEIAYVTTYNTTFTLVNNESVDVPVHWQAHSSAAGDFDQGDVTVPKNGHVNVTKGYYYTTTGTLKIDYAISYRGNKLDTWSGTMNVAP
jgi:hypothetical protein